jgi:hypothetical protein
MFTTKPTHQFRRADRVGRPTFRFVGRKRCQFLR